MIARLLNYVLKRQRRPRLSAELIVPYSPDSAPQDGEILMIARVGKDPYSALAHAQGLSMLDYLKRLPRPRPRWRKRLVAWLRHIEGSSEYEPYKHLQPRTLIFFDETDTL